MSDPLIFFGGSFDPVHQAHIEAALAASHALDNATVNFLPAARSPLKKHTFASDQQRLEMLELALFPWPTLAISDYDITRPAPSYTIHTLQYFRALHPQTPLVLVMGADSFAALDQWYQWERFVTLCHLLVLPRPGAATANKTLCEHFPEAPATQLLSSPYGYRLMMTQPQIDLSSTQIRQQLAAGQPGRLPPAVSKYIATHRLYQSTL